MTGSLGAFGYNIEDRPTFVLTGFQAAEAKNSETLEPLVLLRLRFAIGADDEVAEIPLRRATDLSGDDVQLFRVAEGVAPTDQIVIPVTVEQAEDIAQQIANMARRARERHFD